MLAFQLNLLSLAKKNKIKKLIHFLFTKEILEVTIFTIAVLATTYLFGWLILTETLQNLANSTLIVNRAGPKKQDTIRNINKLITKITSASDGYVAITPKLLEIIKLIPNNIRLNALTLNREDKTLLLSGMAETRDALLDFNNTLNNITWIQTPPTPTSELLLKNSIPFTIKASLKNFAPLSEPKKPSISPRQISD